MSPFHEIGRSTRGFSLAHQVFESGNLKCLKHCPYDDEDSSQHFTPVLRDKASHEDRIFGQIGAGSEDFLTDKGIVARGDEEWDLVGVGRTRDLDGSSRGTDFREDQRFSPEGPDQDVGRGLRGT